MVGIQGRVGGESARVRGRNWERGGRVCSRIPRGKIGGVSVCTPSFGDTCFVFVFFFFLVILKVQSLQYYINLDKLGCVLVINEPPKLSG